MYERFTDRARKVLQLANQEAQRFNHDYIGTEHILLGLIKEGSGIAANVLKSLELDLPGLRAEVQRLAPPGSDRVIMGRLPHTPDAKKVIEHAIAESHSLAHEYIGTEHVLLALLWEKNCLAGRVLVSLGLTLEQIRERVLAVLGPGAVQHEAPATPAPQKKPLDEPDRLPDHAKMVLQRFDELLDHLLQATKTEVHAQDSEKAASIVRVQDLVKNLRACFLGLWPSNPDSTK
jgi:ATP-dependent Clp protease ATP-binding subunit ClpC